MYSMRCLPQKLVVLTEYRFQKQVVIVAMKLPVSQKRLTENRFCVNLGYWSFMVKFGGQTR